MQLPASSSIRTRLEGIESLRAYAALSVILFHLVWVGKVAVPSPLSFIGTYFGQGVALFFVVSGFSLAYGYAGKLTSPAAVSGYFLRRLARIAPLFYAALVFQLACLWLFYDVKFPPLDVGLNALFVFNLVPALVDGIVPASWTIGIEMIFYAVFPMLILLCTTLPRTAIALAIAIATAARFDGHDHAFIRHFPLFLWGIARYHAFNTVRHHARAIGWACIAVAFAGLVMICSSELLHRIMSRNVHDAFWGLPFMLLCVGIALVPTALLSNAVTRYLGKISFSLYLTHANIVNWLNVGGVYSWVYGSMPGSKGGAFVACALVATACVTALSALTFRYIEQPGMNWGKRAQKRVTPAAMQPT